MNLLEVIIRWILSQTSIFHATCYLSKIRDYQNKNQKIEASFVNIVCQMEFSTRYRRLRYSRIHTTSMETQCREVECSYHYRDYYHNRLSEKVERDKSNAKAHAISMIDPSSETMKQSIANSQNRSWPETFAGCRTGRERSTLAEW